MTARCTRNRTRNVRGTSHVVAATAAIFAGGFCLPVAAGVTPVQPKSGDPLAGLTAEQLSLFEQGKAKYSHIFTNEEGKGPLFNKAGCISCHANPLGGWGTITVTRYGFSDKGTFIDPPGGSLFQVSAISAECVEVMPPGAVTATRVTNSSMAFGLIEAIPDAAIAANHDPNDLNGDGARGRVHWVTAFEDPAPRRGRQPILRAGRFGWKAQVATVTTFSADAALNEMGITNRFLMEESAPNGDLELLALCDTTPEPEDVPDMTGRDFVDWVTFFQRYLAAPPQTPKSGMSGEVVFHNLGCAKCHIPEWTTGNRRGLEGAIAGKTIKPYSDFLLHDMGMLGDGIVQGAASGQELRTPTLWNLRTRDPLLHDASVSGGEFHERMRAAILAHGPFPTNSANAMSAAAFELLESTNPEQVQQLYAFLASLGRREFDFEGDEFITIFDYYDFRDCFNAGGVVTPDDHCAIHDIDQDGDVDGNDFDSFLTVYEGVIEDCNNNGTIDLKEILLGQLPDADDDGISDVCSPACPADVDQNGEVDGADLGLLLGAWGTPDAASDLNGDGDVDGADLGLLLGAWGSCG